MANVSEEVGKAAHEARGMAEDVVQSREVVGRRASYERQRRGWRSEAFTL